MSDRQMVAVRFAGILVACLLAFVPPVQAGPWPACNAAGLSPPAAIDRPTPPYPESARQAGAEGFVDVAFTILGDQSTEVLDSISLAQGAMWEERLLGGSETEVTR